MKTKRFGKNFTLVVLGQIISLFGNAILRFALPLYLLRETNSPALFGIVSACSFLPMILLSFLGGIVADRINKRNIMVFLDFLTAVIIFALYFALGTLPLVPLLLVALMLLYGISGAYQPAVQASIPVLVAQEDVLAASAIVNEVSSLAGLLGPIFGGMLFGSFGIFPVLIISTLCFLASAVMEIFIHIPFVKREHTAGVFAIIRDDFHDSLHYMLHKNPILIKIIGCIAVFNLILSAMLMVGIPVLIIETLHMRDALLGFAQGFLALGGLVGGFLTALFSKKLKLQNASILLLLCSFSVGWMGLSLPYVPSAMVNYCVITLASSAVMIFATMFSIQMMAAVQTQTPPELVGKVIALILSIALCAQPIGQTIYGILFDLFPDDSGMILLFVAALSALVGIASKKAFQQMTK